MTTSHNHIPNKIAGVLCARIFVAVAASIWFTSSSVTALAEIQSKQADSRRALSQKRGIVTRAMILEAQERLIDLGYWIGEAEGKWGEASRAGLIAFQKVENRPRTGKLTAAELQALNAASRPSPLERGSAHIEVDLKRQVLFVVDAGGAISKILPVSTGDGKMFTVDDYTQPAVTPTGRFHVYHKLPGWRKSPLGLLYYPNYIVGGIAIHGNPSVPAQPASHGCVRIPMFAAEEFSEMTPIGTEVIVHDGGAASARDSPSLPQTWNHR
jgi:lipoprotein-anchoring transpeptidase ErfK/SrfK